ncbi:MAG: cadmium-translocating P-type ATPase [Clostridia bacterium]|nr:cadmium-translocating P-type ATPase [Clostridia bacterium]MBQ9749411.1 cadmium-translocating P-type ATPase [Clostridia bacterium]
MTSRHKKTLLRIIISALLLLIAFIIPVSGIWKLAAFLIPYLIIGYDIILKSLKNIFHGEIFDENFLMTIASIGAFFINEYPEAVLVIILYQVGELFQGIAVGKSRRSIKALTKLCPTMACVIRNGEEVHVSPSEIVSGENVIVRPGERIPIDGTIVSGSADLDTSAITGEPIPRSLAEGDEVISGFLSLNGVITVKASGGYSESTLSKIITLVGDSATKKARVENFISRFAKYYTPCVVICALMLAFIPGLIIGKGFSLWIERALIFLVVSCPCALVISVPLSFFGGIGGASRNGILIKGASYLEILSKTDTLVFDKTGTLTEGRFTVSEVHSLSLPESELLEIAALAQSYSTHPIARSIAASVDISADTARVSEVKEIPGMGISAIIDKKTVLAGNAKLMRENAIQCDETESTAVHIARDREYLGYLLLCDSIKKDAADAISEARELGIKKTVILTGDTKGSAEKVKDTLEIDELHASLLPEGKVSAMGELIRNKKSGRYVAFVGDGINDAPVMSVADVSIAMGGSGTDIALEASDIVLMNDNISSVTKAIKISKKTMAIVKQNIILALGTKAAVLILGALGYANMYLALFADVGILIIATLNAMRTLKSNKEKKV